MTRLISLALGVFVCWEIVFLPLSNFWQLLPREMPPLPPEVLARRQETGRANTPEIVRDGIEAIGRVNDGWAELTGQYPGWSLFSPTIGDGGVFLTLSIETAAGRTDELRSLFEPADPARFIRFDATLHHRFNREIIYAVIFALWRRDSFINRGPEWKEAINEQVAAFGISQPRFVRWRVREWEANHPGEQVVRVRLGVRKFGINEPGREPARLEPALLPLALWNAERPGEMMPYDPVAGAYVAVAPGNQ